MRSLVIVALAGALALLGAVLLATTATAAIVEPQHGANVSGYVSIYEDTGSPPHTSNCWSQPATYIEVRGVSTYYSRTWKGDLSGPMRVQWNSTGAPGGLYNISSQSTTYVWNATKNACDAKYDRSKIQVTLVVPRTASLELDLPAAAYADERLPMSATLRDADTGAPLAGRSLRFTHGDGVATATTDALGVARMTVIARPYTPDVTATFQGDAAHGAVHRTVAASILPRPTELWAAAPLSGHAGEAGVIELAQIDVRSGAMIDPRTIQVMLGDGTQPVDATGGRAVFPLPDAPTALPLSAWVDGDARYLGAAMEDTFHVLPRPTRVHVEAADGAVRGAPASFVALVVDDTPGSVLAGTPLADATVAFALGTESWSGTTTPDGVAEVDVEAMLAGYGAHVGTARFAGAQRYAPSVAEFPFEVRWDRVFEDEWGAGEVRLNRITNEVQVATPNGTSDVKRLRAPSAHDLAALQPDGERPELTASEHRRVRSVAYADRQLAITGTFDVTTGEFVAAVALDGAPALLRATEWTPNAPPQPEVRISDAARQRCEAWCPPILYPLIFPSR